MSVSSNMSECEYFFINNKMEDKFDKKRQIEKNREKTHEKSNRLAHQSQEHEEKPEWMT